MALPINVEPGLFTSPRLIDKSKMVDFDVPLNGIIGLPLPDTGRFVQTQVVAAGQLTHFVLFQAVGVVDDDFCTDIIAVPVALRQNRADALLFHVVCVNVASIMRYDDGLPLVGRKALFSKDFFRQPQLPALGTVRVVINKNAHRCHDGMVYKVALICEIGSIQRQAVKALNLHIVFHIEQLPSQVLQDGFIHGHRPLS